MKHRIQYYLLKPLLLLVGVLPRSTSLFLARFAGTVFFTFSRKRRSIAIQNLDSAFGEKYSRQERNKIARRSFQNLAMALIDLLIVKKFLPIAKEKIEIRGLENYEKALSHGKGVVLALSHMGSWEYMAFLFTLTNTTCSAIVKEIRNPYFNQVIDSARRLTGLLPIPKKNSVKIILKALKANQTAAVLIDQWAGPEGVWDYFFNRQTSITTIPYRLASKTGCALLPGFCLRKNNTEYIIDVCPPIFLDPETKQDNEEFVTIELNKILEEKIKQHPEQWTWGHRRWKSKPENMRHLNSEKSDQPAND
jgi:KDO2-lipid IV(A) lauroyltransferase